MYLSLLSVAIYDVDLKVMGLRLGLDISSLIAPCLLGLSGECCRA